MKYRVYWTKTAVKDLKRLGRRISERIIDTVEEASLNPLRFFKKLKTAPLYSLRVGDYRVIASIDHKKQSIIVLAVEHRRKAYKKIK
ncbi:MAG TPA: type II toxin-antitoxin system RelE/ParE family toxin [Candidatus Bathyarchaeota archaeon]|nr:type II toxin-antitoxin system RelE/ParE family toxin [Candidatus Bathyarchaeota archaeon]